MEMKLTFKLDDFEGPLDLLLTLLGRHKIDICDIPILSLIEQYLETIRQWQMLDLEIATEFLTMAARLIQMKTVMLLPRHEEEGEEMSRTLAGELLEYQMIKLMAGKLSERYDGYSRFVRKPTRLEADPTYTRRHLASDLLDALRGALGNKQRRLPPPASAFTGIVGRRQVSVTSRVIFVLRRFYHTPHILADELFASCGERPEMVATFLAVLELVRAGRLDYNEEDGMLSFVGRGDRHPRRTIVDGLS